jgi:hypothetical protein
MNSSTPSTPQESGSGQAEPDFMSLFCEQNRCPLSEFEERAFRACLYWRARILAPIIRLLWPRYFDRDFALIRYLAKCRSRRNAINELAAYMEANSDSGGFPRKLLHIRISARKASALVGRVFEQRREPVDDGSAWTI